MLFQLQINDTKYKFGIDENTEEILNILFNKFNEHIINNPLIEPIAKEPEYSNTDDDNSNNNSSDDNNSNDNDNSTDDNKENYNGEYKKYYKNGKVKTVENYIDGSMHGEFIYYNKNGELDEIINYVYGSKDGKYYKYNNGILEIECEYYRDEYLGEGLVGAYITYYSNGKIKDIHNYDHDRLDGEFCEYYYNGGKKTLGNYEGGYKHGYEYKYDENGVVISKIFIDDTKEDDEDDTN